ncbi:Hop-interacting THI110 [Olea europaea subsp. europaea]|uniref:Hop-interacting THI110 n=1 Tax=Olea europaea subsp. europaea TaxID=158383 RepID=A0A8S0QSV9_OLEEU|nr:Hop-interacting THI110 [Olea europaea subsp. europaea]
MYEQHLLDLQDNNGFGSDPKSWLSDGNSGGGGEGHSSLASTLSSVSAAAANASAASNVDRVLFNDLVEIVPLVQSLIDRKANTSFTRRGSIIYTKTPTKESIYKKTARRNATQSIPTKKHRDREYKDENKHVVDSQDGDADNVSLFSSRSFQLEKEREELVVLSEQVEDLQKRISQKDELLESAELSKNEMASMYTRLDELKNEITEKELLIKSTQLQLSDAKIELADKQAAVEKLQWESMTSNKKVVKLQEDLEMVEGQVSSMMVLIQGLASTHSALLVEDYDDVPHPLDHDHGLDDVNEIERKKLEAAREAYIIAVAGVKEKQDEESIAAAANARLHLQSLVLKQT